MIMKLGFLLSQYGEQPLSKVFLESANAYLDGRTDVDIIGFVSNHVSTPSNLHPSFATMNVNEVYDFKGVVVATTLDMAEKSIKCPGPRKLYYYLWDLDWGTSGRSYEELLSLFHNPRISLVARTQEDAKVIQQCWNRTPIAIIPDCNVGEFVEMAKKDDKK